MKAKRFSEEQIIGVLKEAEAGAKTKELCRRHGISETTFYNWKAKYAVMTVSEARRLKELEQENAKLKRLLTETEFDKAALATFRSCPSFVAIRGGPWPAAPPPSACTDRGRV